MLLPCVVPPRSPLPFMAKLAALMSLKIIELPVVPPATAVTTTVAPVRAAVTKVGMSRVIEVTMAVPSVVVLEFNTTWPVPLPEVTKVKTCGPSATPCGAA